VTSQRAARDALVIVCRDAFNLQELALQPAVLHSNIMALG
jgi:hypothetical protein